MIDKERQLVAIAQYGNDDQANEAMKKLREEYDPTYCYCLDCDQLVVKESECCLNRKVVEDDKPDDLNF